MNSTEENGLFVRLTIFTNIHLQPLIHPYVTQRTLQIQLPVSR